MEFLSPDKRTAATLVSFASWTFGMCLTSLVSWLLPNWQYLALVSCVPSILCFAYWRYLPESPRWLLAQGRINECASILLNVARINGKKDLSRVQLESDLHILWNLQEREVSLKEATRYSKLRLRALILFFMGACSYLCYGMVFLGISVLSSNYFLSHFVVSISELPSNALGWLWTQFLGRRFTCITTYLITAALVAAAPFCRHDKWLMLAIVAVIRLFCAQLIYVAYVQCTEIFPTPVRSTGLAWLIVCGLATMISTPFLLHSGIGEDFPWWLLLALMLLCAFLGTYLPETIGLPLPQSFQDAEDLGNGRPLKVWIHHWNHHRFVPISSQEDRYQELRRLSITNPDGLRRMSFSDRKMSR